MTMRFTCQCGATADHVPPVVVSCWACSRINAFQHAPSLAAARDNEQTRPAREPVFPTPVVKVSRVRLLNPRTEYQALAGLDHCPASIGLRGARLVSRRVHSERQPPVHEGEHDSNEDGSARIDT